jgi:hypothetical protein
MKTHPSQQLANNQTYRWDFGVEGVLRVVQARDDNTVSLKIWIQLCAYVQVHICSLATASDKVVIAVPLRGIEALKVLAPTWKGTQKGKREK